MPRPMLVVRTGFTQGVNYDLDPLVVPKNALWRSLNVRADESGLLRIRPGAEYVGPSLGAGPMQGGISAFGKILIAWNRNLYAFDGSAYTTIGSGIVGNQPTDKVKMVRWASGGSEIVYQFAGNGIYQTNGQTAQLVTPHTPEAGTPENLIRASDGSQDVNSGPARCRVALIRASLGQRLAASCDPQSPNTVYLSDPFRADYWPSDQIIQLPDDGGRIVWLANWYNALVIFRDKDIWAFFGDSVTTSGSALVLQDSSMGCVAGRTVAPLPGVGIAFLGRDNVYALRRVTGLENQATVEPVGNKIVKPLRVAMADGTDWACGAHYDNKYFLRLPESAEMERAFCLSLLNMGWYPESGLDVTYLLPHNGQLYGLLKREGRLVRMERGLNDAGAAIPFSVTLPREALQPGPSRIRRLLVYAVSKGSVSTDTVRFFGFEFGGGHYNLMEAETVTALFGTEQHLSVSVIADGREFVVRDLEVYVTRVSHLKLAQIEPIRIYEARFRPSLKANFAQIKIRAMQPEEDIAVIGYGIEYEPRATVRGLREGVTQVI